MRQLTKEIIVNGNENLQTILEGQGYFVEEIEFISSISRMRGTGYKNVTYAAKKQDLSIKICLNIYSQEGFYNNVEVKKLSVVQAKKRGYAQQVGEACKFYNFPFELGLAIGTEYMEELDSKLNTIETLETSKKIERRYRHELEVGIGRRKNGIKHILGEPLYNNMNIESMGQINSDRVADYLLSLDSIWKID